MQSALDLHNKYRSWHDAPPLCWSSQVGNSAQYWADTLKSQYNCQMNHNRDDDYGENLGRGYRTLNGAIDAWYEEEELYNYNSPGFSMDTGHFTQVVWKDTEYLGCGIADCGSQKIYVCQYDPPGNFRGRYEQNVTPPNNRG
mmetsp:Transcript_4975/g.8843  ORF Transcript_4975/g.8843 Transcript_4975/m.8843 type:complete len:142 (-) Transcript_4975:378-803(-)